MKMKTVIHEFFPDPSQLYIRDPGKQDTAIYLDVCASLQHQQHGRQCRYEHTFIIIIIIVLINNNLIIIIILFYNRRCIPSRPLTRPAPTHAHAAHLSVQGEAVVYPSRKNNQVSRDHLNPDPSVCCISHIKVSTSFHDEANFLISVEVFLKEHPYLRTGTIYFDAYIHHMCMRC